ncbi:Crp/Fnr family transcriptional regulator [Rhodococcus aetherivorans]
MTTPPLDGIRALAGLDPEARDRIAALAHPVRFAAGEHVFHEGGEARSCWLLQDGRVDLYTVVPGRGQVTLDTFVDGDVLGWSWLTPPYRWHYGAVAAAATSALEVDAAALQALSEADAEFGYTVMRALFGALLERLQATRARLLDLYAGPDVR